ncbi:MAG: hypothetical protein EPN24_03500 [Candidatus Methanoperedens sp.]|nr:MAG: hypothetical protein EPN24_03500 [Candidatus Methanoperedens sp.]
MGKTTRIRYRREFKFSLIRELERLVGKLYAENDFSRKPLPGQNQCLKLFLNNITYFSVSHENISSPLQPGV